MAARLKGRDKGGSEEEEETTPLREGHGHGTTSTQRRLGSTRGAKVGERGVRGAEDCDWDWATGRVESNRIESSAVAVEAYRAAPRKAEAARSLTSGQRSAAQPGVGIWVLHWLDSRDWLAVLVLSPLASTDPAQQPSTASSAGMASGDERELQFSPF
jgi:hypothetical protein